MADAPDDQEDVHESSKSGSMKWIIIGVVAVVVIAGGAAGAWFFLFDDEKVKPTAAQTAKGVPQPPLVAPTLSMKPFIVNLAEPGGKRYLKVKLDLELTNKEVKTELEARISEVRHQIIMVLSSKTYQQIQSVAGKTVLLEELMARANAVLKKGKVKKTFFTEFVVQ